MKLTLIVAIVGLICVQYSAGNAPFRVTGDIITYRKRQAACGTPVRLDATQKDAAVVANNLFRSHEQATNLKKLIWNENLGALGQKLVDTCIFHHDFMKNCNGDGIGQNIFMATAAGGANPPLNFTAATENWASERKLWNFQTGTCTSAYACGHWSQLAAASALEVGCAYNYCPSITSSSGKVFVNAIYIACNFNPEGNKENVAVYQSGTPCTNCDSEGVGGGYKCTNNLCEHCSPTTDSACKCATPLTCVNNGVWTPASCTCVCPKGFYGHKCENSCVCSDVMDCSTYTSLCPVAIYRQHMKDNCRKTCNFCDLPASCSA